MGQIPFRRSGTADSAASRRRSTRVEFSVPIVLTGRDAAGQPFREETETSTVNLRGCKLRTRHSVLVGMQVGLENPRLGVSGKAICVWVGETPPGETAHDIAVQLLKPGNLWGLENPPDDWERVAAELGGPPAAFERARPATAGRPQPVPIAAPMPARTPP